MWKASAINAREWTAKPTDSSSKKNMMSMTSITLMRVDFDHPILLALDREGKPLQTSGDQFLKNYTKRQRSRNWFACYKAT